MIYAASPVWRRKAETFQWVVIVTVLAPQALIITECTHLDELCQMPNILHIPLLLLKGLDMLLLSIMKADFQVLLISLFESISFVDGMCSSKVYSSHYQKKDIFWRFETLSSLQHWIFSKYWTCQKQLNVRHNCCGNHKCYQSLQNYELMGEGPTG